MFEGLELPLRDILRVFVPGLFATLYLDLGSLFLQEKHLFGGDYATAYFFASVLACGLLGYAANFHRWLWPWKSPWRNQLAEIREALCQITGESYYTAEQHGKPIYKIWLDAISESPIRKHLHYETGLFYMFTNIAVYSFAFASYATIWLIYLGTVAAGDGPNAGWAFLHEADVTELLISLAVCGLFTLAFYRESMRKLVDVIQQGRMAMHMDQSKVELRALASAAVEIRSVSRDPEVLLNEVRRGAAYFRPIDAQNIRSVSLSGPIDQFVLRTDTCERVMHLTVCADRLETAIRLNGRDNLFNGPVQQRVEGILNERLAGRLGVKRVRVQFQGDRPLQECLPSVVERKEIDRLDLDESLRLGLIPKNGVVHECCKRYGVSCILLRNGNIIGPNPDLALVLEEMMHRLQDGAVVFDPFAGTSLTDAICKASGRRITCKCFDLGVQGTAAVHADAFEIELEGAVDVIVVDPLYEDVFVYLERCLRWKCEYVVVQSGDDCDVAWNKAIADRLQTWGTRVADISRH